MAGRDYNDKWWLESSSYTNRGGNTVGAARERQEAEAAAKAEEERKAAAAAAKAQAEQDRLDSSTMVPDSIGESTNSSKDSADSILGDWGSYFDNFVTTASDYSKMGTQYMQSMVDQAKQSAFVEQQSLLETQKRYGISGAVAQGQMNSLNMQTQQNIMTAQNEAAMAWWQQTSTVQSDMSIYLDQKNTAMAQSILDKVMNEEFSQSEFDEMKNTLGDDYDWDKLQSFVDLDVQDARSIWENLTNSNQFLNGTGEEEE